MPDFDRESPGFGPSFEPESPLERISHEIRGTDALAKIEFTDAAREKAYRARWSERWQTKHPYLVALIALAALICGVFLFLWLAH